MTRMNGGMIFTGVLFSNIAFGDTVGEAGRLRSAARFYSVTFVAAWTSHHVVWLFIHKHTAASSLQQCSTVTVIHGFLILQSGSPSLSSFPVDVALPNHHGNLVIHEQKK